MTALDLTAIELLRFAHMPPLYYVLGPACGNLGATMQPHCVHSSFTSIWLLLTPLTLEELLRIVRAALLNLTKRGGTPGPG